MKPVLVIGNRNYSSWSLRAWLHLSASGVEFEDVRVPMFTGEWRRAISRYSPAGRVPVLIHGPVTVWDSMAIMEHALESFPAAVGWPADPPARAHARSVAAEMHSGFMALRDELPQNLRRRTALPPESLSEDCRAQIGRVTAIWVDCLDRYGGPWLFGGLSIADVMFAPVALRFRTYGIDLPGTAAGFADAVTSMPLVREWCRAAGQEEESLPFIDDLLPASDSPLTLG